MHLPNGKPQGHFDSQEQNDELAMARHLSTCFFKRAAVHNVGATRQTWQAGNQVSRCTWTRLLRLHRPLHPFLVIPPPSRHRPAHATHTPRQDQASITMLAQSRHPRRQPCRKQIRQTQVGGADQYLSQQQVSAKHKSSGACAGKPHRINNQEVPPW